jgi:hypothetical protein
MQGGNASGVNSTNAKNGTYNAFNNGSWNSIFQNVSGFQPNTSYTLTVWGKLSAANNRAHCFYISNDGGATRDRVYLTSTHYIQYSLTFTTGSNTTVQIGEENPSGASVTASFDDFALALTNPTTPPPSAGTNVPLTNPGFEGGGYPWLGGGTVHGINSLTPHIGSYNSYNNGSWNSIFQTVTGLSPNTSYTLKAWARLGSDAAGDNQAIYVTSNGVTKRTWIRGTAYAQYTVDFTTGSNTSVEIGNMDSGSNVVAYTDDYTLTKN